MADARSLRLIGILYGALAAVIGLIAVIVVTNHVMGTRTLDEAANASVEISASRR